MGKQNQEGIVRSNTLGKESLNIPDLCPLTHLLAETVKLHEGVRIQSSIKWVLLLSPRWHWGQAVLQRVSLFFLSVSGPVGEQ